MPQHISSATTPSGISPALRRKNRVLGVAIFLASMALAASVICYRAVFG